MAIDTEITATQTLSGPGFRATNQPPDLGVFVTSGLSVTDGAGGPVAELLPAAGKAYFMGRLGLGTINPQNVLDVEGAMAVGAGYSGSFAAPANGLIVEGNFGLGTTAPGAKLDVVGTLRVSQDAQLLGKVGVGIATPQNALDVKGTIAVGAGPGYAGTAIAAANSLVVEGSVGIGTNAPGAKLDIAGTMRVTQDALLLGKVGVGIATPQNALDVKGALAVGAGYSGAALAPANGLIVEGDVGIGTNAPGAKLDVAGTMRVSQDAQLLGKVGVGIATPQNALDVKGALAVGAGYSGAALAPANGLIVEGDVGIGTNAPGAKLDVAGTLKVSQGAYLAVSSGNVGVGTASPAAKLQVSGGALMPSAGNAATAGILFPPNPGGGAGDAAWMRYYVRAGESTTLEIGVANEADDHIALIPSGNVGIGISNPTGAKLVIQDVVGTEMRINGNSGTYGLSLGADANQPWIGSRTNHDLRIVTNGSEKLRVTADGGVFIPHAATGTPSSRSLEIGSQTPVAAGVANGRIGFPGHGIKHGQLRWMPAPGEAGRFEFINSSNASPSGDYGANPGFVSLKALNGSFTGTLTVAGSIMAGKSDIYFTDVNHGHTGLGNAAGNAAIENAVNHDALMILGRAGTDKGRKVRLWDYLSVEGSLNVTGQISFGSGSVLSGDQGGSIELGNSLQTGVVPFIDFHYGTGVQQDFNMRIINNADRTLTIDGGDVVINGRLGTGGWSPVPRTRGWGGGIHTWDVEAEGTMWSRHGYGSGPRDLAENYRSEEKLQPGDVVCVDPKKDNIVKSSKPNDPMVLGIISTKPGFLLNVDHEVEGGAHFPVALCGRVPCKVVNENGAIKKGDLLTPSSKSGHAMKAKPIEVDDQIIYRPGTIIGKALQGFNDKSGSIEIFVFSS